MASFFALFSQNVGIPGTRNRSGRCTDKVLIRGQEVGDSVLVRCSLLIATDPIGDLTGTGVAAQIAPVGLQHAQVEALWTAGETVGYLNASLLALQLAGPVIL